MWKPVIFGDAVRRQWGTLVTGGAIIGALGIWQGTGHTLPSGVYWVVGVAGLAFSFYRAWLEQHTEVERLRNENDDRKPRLRLKLESTLYVYDKEKDLTVFVLSAFILNAGAPTVVTGWHGKYIVGSSEEDMKGFYFIDAYDITIGNETITLTNENLIKAQVLTKQLLRGDAKVGRLILTVPGDRRDEVKACKYKIRVECFDFEGTPTLAEFSPDAAPIQGIQMYPGERVRQISKENASPEGIPPQLPSAE